MASTVFATVTTPGPPGPTGPPGYSPVYIVQSGPPGVGIGQNGDMYIDSSNGNVYGPKAAGAWGGVVCNIKGPTGPTGATGPAGYSPLYIVAAGPPSPGVGNNGDMYINSSNDDVYGPKTAGAWGSVRCNIKGSTGVQGPPGVGYRPMGAWSASVTYAQGDQVTDVNLLYIALQGGNLNHVPASSPTWWENVGSGVTQTPWLSSIDGGGNILFNVGEIGVGVASPISAIHARVATDQNLLIGGVGWALTGSVGFNAVNDANNANIPMVYVASPHYFLGKVGLGVSGPSETLSLSGGNLMIDAFTDAGTTGFAALHGIYFRVGFGSANATEANRRNCSITTGQGTSNLGDAIDINAAHHVSIWGAGQERFRLDGSSGNVGIGGFSNTPVQRLDVWGGVYGVPATSGSATNAAVRIGASGHGEILDIGAGSGTGTPALWMQPRLYNDYSTNYNLVLNPNGGNVGIGSGAMAPVYPLHIATFRGGTPSVAYHTADAHFSVDVPGNVELGIGWLAAAPYSMWLQARSGNAIPINLNPSGGNVSVGTTTPLVTFHCRAASGGMPPTSGTTPGGILCIDTGSGGNGLYFGVQGAAPLGSWIQATDRNTFAATYPLLLQPNGGYVGVGSASVTPQVPLDIVAAAGDNALRLRQTNAPTAAYFTIAVDSVLNGALRIDGFSGGVTTGFVQQRNGNCGIKNNNPSYALDVAGDCNVSGAFRVGGVAISSGGITTKSIATGSRAQGTVYQNSTGKPLFAVVSSLINANSYMQLLIDNSNPPTTVVCAATNPSTSIQATMAISGWVMPGEFYKVFSAGGTLSAWIEWW